MFYKSLPVKLFLFSLVVAFTFIFLFPITLSSIVVYAGVIPMGILGPVRGKVGNVVGANWKGIDYIRGYNIPANPNSTDQQTQRTKFLAVQNLVRQVLGNLVANYWNPFATKRSGYNNLTSEFLMTVDASNKLQVSTLVSKGTLETLGQLTATYNTSNGVVDLSWTNISPTGNGLGSDVVRAVIYDKVNQLLYYRTVTEVRSVGGDTVTIASGLTATNVIAFAFAVQGSGSSMIVSDSVSDVCAAP